MLRSLDAALAHPDRVQHTEVAGDRERHGGCRLAVRTGSARRWKGRAPACASRTRPGGPGTARVRVLMKVVFVLPPMIAAAVMAAASLSVVTDASRLRSIHITQQRCRRTDRLGYLTAPVVIAVAWPRSRSNSHRNGAAPRRAQSQGAVAQADHQQVAQASGQLVLHLPIPQLGETRTRASISAGNQPRQAHPAGLITARPPPGRGGRTRPPPRRRACCHPRGRARFLHAGATAAAGSIRAFTPR